MQVHDVGGSVRVPPRIRPPHRAQLPHETKQQHLPNQCAKLEEAQKYVCRVIFHRGSSHVRLRIFNKLRCNVHSHVRIKREFIIIIPCTYNRDLTEVRHTHMRVNIHHLHAFVMHIQRDKY